MTRSQGTSNASPLELAALLRQRWLRPWRAPSAARSGPATQALLVQTAGPPCGAPCGGCRGRACRQGPGACRQQAEPFWPGRGQPRRAAPARRARAWAPARAPASRRARGRAARPAPCAAPAAGRPASCPCEPARRCPCPPAPPGCRPPEERAYERLVVALQQRHGGSSSDLLSHKYGQRPPSGTDAETGHP